METNYRFEFKYLLDRETALDIENYIKNIGLTIDPAARFFGGQDYLVTSLYFDSPFLGDYYDKVSGLLRRKKIRARIYGDSYNESSLVWLEIKHKHDMYVSKKRLRFCLADWQIFLNQFLRTGNLEMLSDRTSSAEKPTLEEISYHMLVGSMRPHILIQYRRRPYLGHFMSPLRITFDSDLKAQQSRSLIPSREMQLVESDKVIMEVKYNSALPLWFGEIIKKFQIARQSYSKYNQAIERVYAYNVLPR